MSSRRNKPRTSMTSNNKKLIYSIATLVFLILFILSALTVVVDLYYLLVGINVWSQLGIPELILFGAVDITSLLVSIVFAILWFVLYRYCNKKRKDF